MMVLSQNLYNCNIPLTNELKLYAKDFFPEKFLYRKFDFVLLCSFSYILFGTYKTQSDLSSLYLRYRKKDDRNRGAGGKGNFNFRIS